MERKSDKFEPMLIFALILLALFGCNEWQKNSSIIADKTISITQINPIISRMYYVAAGGLQTRAITGTPASEDLDYLDYWTITFKGDSDTLVMNSKSANGEIADVYLKYKFENGFLKVFNPNKPLWETMGYGNEDRILFFVDYVVYRDEADGPFWINLNFRPDRTMEETLRLNENDLFCTVSNLTLGNIAGYDDLNTNGERLYWRVVSYILE